MVKGDSSNSDVLTSAGSRVAVPIYRRVLLGLGFVVLFFVGVSFLGLDGPSLRPPAGWTVMTYPSLSGALGQELKGYLYYNGTIQSPGKYNQKSPIIRQDEIDWLAKQTRAVTLGLQWIDLEALDLAGLEAIEDLFGLNLNFVKITPQQMKLLICRPTLNNISLGGMPFTESMVAGLEPSRWLTTLMISSPTADSAGLGSLHKIESLGYLVFYDVELTEAVVLSLSQHPNVSSLTLGNAELTAEVLGGIVEMPSLESLNLQSIADVRPEHLEVLNNHHMLRELYLPHYFEGKYPDAIEKFRVVNPIVVIYF